MIIDEQNPNHILAASGMTFQRVADNLIYGNEIYLGYTYYINGKKLDTPKLESKDDFIEITQLKE